MSVPVTTVPSVPYCVSRRFVLFSLISILFTIHKRVNVVFADTVISAFDTVGHHYLFVLNFVEVCVYMADFISTDTLKAN